MNNRPPASESAQIIADRLESVAESLDSLAGSIHELVENKEQPWSPVAKLGILPAQVLLTAAETEKARIQTQIADRLRWRPMGSGAAT